MISRPAFIALLDAIKGQRELDQAVSAHLNAIVRHENPPSVYTTPLVQEVVAALNTDMELSASAYVGTDLDWWCFDAPAMGDGSVASRTLYHHDGGETVLHDHGDLYDVIVSARAERGLPGGGRG